MKRVLSSLIFIAVAFISSQAQDIDFTQFYSIPSFVNPALTGGFNGTYRVGAAYRSQWRSVSPYPISTYAFNGEYRIPLQSMNRKIKDVVGLGLKFYSDRVKVLEANSNAVYLTAAFHKSLNQQTDEFLSGGIEIGLVQRNLNYQVLQFEDQFDKINDFNLPTGEVLEANNLAYGDYSLGLNYSRKINKTNQIGLGFTLKHLTTPNISFWRDTKDKNPKLISKNDLPLLIGAQYVSHHDISYRFRLSPRVVFQKQGTHYQIMTGSTLRFNIGSEKNKAMHLGIFSRLTNNQSSPITLATVSPFFGFEINHALLGISYDFLVQDIGKYFKNISVLEFTVRYTGETMEDTAICPEF